MFIQNSFWLLCNRPDSLASTVDPYRLSAFNGSLTSLSLCLGFSFSLRYYFRSWGTILLPLIVFGASLATQGTQIYLRLKVDELFVRLYCFPHCLIFIRPFSLPLPLSPHTPQARAPSRTGGSPCGWATCTIRRSHSTSARTARSRPDRCGFLYAFHQKHFCQNREIIRLVLFHIFLHGRCVCV